MYLFTLMLLLCLRTKNYLSPQLLVYLPIYVLIHDPTCSFSFRLTVKNYPSTFPLFYMSTDVPFHQYTCSVHFFLGGGITCAMGFELIYWGTYTQIHPKVNLPVYLHASLPSNHKGLLVTTITCIHAHRCTRSLPYVFIFRLSFQLTVKIYPFTVLLFYMSTDVPVHRYTCSVCFFFFGIIYTMTFHLLGYLHTDPPENIFTCLPSCFSFV